MKRKKRSLRNVFANSWLITYADMTTLLLTFFVLLFSMSSMDLAFISRLSASFSNTSPDKEFAGKMATEIVEVVHLLQDPESVLQEQERIKDLLFPNVVLPQGMNWSDAKKNIMILEHPEGVAIVLTDKLLYSPGEYKLSPSGVDFINALSPVLLMIDSDINISGNTNKNESRLMSDYELSALRALGVLEQLLATKIEKDRFSISGYGSDKPLWSEKGVINPTQNSRIEILLKTDKRHGKYV